MLRGTKLIATALAVFTVGLVFGDAKVTGAWNGKVVVDQASLPKLTDPNQKKMMDSVIASVKKMTFSLNINANKSFTMKVKGIPQGQGSAGKPEQTAEGTWSQKGNVITLKVTKENGGPPKGMNKPQDLQVLEGGKKLELSGPGMRGGKVVFVR